MNRLSEVASLIKKDKFVSFGGRFSDLLPAEDRGFVQNIVESWKRGDEQILTDIAIYESMREGVNIEDALRLRKKYQRKEIVDPVEGNFISNLVYKGIKILPGWYQSAKEGGVWAALFGSLGAIGGAAVGAVIPTIGEEPLTIAGGAAIGAKLGAKFGFTTGSAWFWYKQGAGGMFADMLEKGYDPQKSWKIAQVAAVPYAALEFMQMKAAMPIAKKGIQEVAKVSVRTIAKKFGKNYLMKLGQEVVEEVAQEAVQIVAEDLASFASKQGVKIDKKFFKDRVSRLGQVAWQSVQAMALLPIPGAAIETTVETAQQQALYRQEKEDFDKRWAGLIGETYGQDALGAEAIKGTEPRYVGYYKPVEILTNTGKKIELDYSTTGAEIAGIIPKDPVGKLHFSLMKSLDKYKEMKLIHKKELTEKFSKAESAMLDSPTAREGLKKARGKMAGVLTELKIEPVESIMSGQEWESIFEEIRDTTNLKFEEKMRLGQALESFVKEGRLFRPNETKLLGKQFGPLMERAMDNLSKLQIPLSLKARILNMIGIPKATSATADLSRTLRQNVLLIGNPKAWYKGLVDEWTLFLNDKDYARQVELAAMTSDYSPIRRKTRLRINEWGERGTYATRAERFPSTNLEKIPIIGAVVARSERAYTVGGNLLRMWLFDKTAKEWENDTSRTYTLKDYDDLAYIYNLLTGEGDIKGLQESKIATLLNAAFFAPRLLIGRFQAIAEIFNPERSLAARKILAHHLVNYVAINAALLMAFSQLPGVSVERDPRSTDFGKIKIGNTRIEFWGGYQPIARFVIEAILGQHKTATGEIMETSRFETVKRFLQSKLGPVPATVIDYLRGETFYGKELDPWDIDVALQVLYERLTPFVIQDILDAIYYQGVGAGALVAPLAFHGVGIQSYDQTPGTKLAVLKDNIAKEVFGQKWRDLGNETQKIIREHFPEIQKKELELEYQYQSPKFVKRIIEEEAQSEKRILKSLSSSLIRQLADTQIRIGGLGKRIGSDWYLNDERFNKYEKLVSQSLNKILPSIFKSGYFDKLLPTEKQLVLGDVIAEVKNEIRQYIIQEANYKDLLHIQGIKL